jgi:nitrate/nitrite-specific signal transduction histidine kinase
LITILISSALPTALLSTFLTQQTATAGADSTMVRIQLTATVLLTVLFTLVNATILAQSVLRPLLILTNAAQAMKQNEFTSQQAAALRNAPTDQTEISQLRQVFGQMAEEVMLREEQLRQQVAALQIMIDEVTRREQVAEITDSDFFRKLQNKAHHMRQRHMLATDAQTTITP